jgi:hypothetical protein
VKRKKIATIPTMPRKSGPKRVCRYVASPVLLSATVGAVASRCVDITSPGVWETGVARRTGRAYGAGQSWMADALIDRTSQLARCRTTVIA